MNYKQLDKVTTDNPFPIPNLKHIINRASRANYIMTLDLVKGFHQILVHLTDIQKTSFSLPWGKWHYKKMPFRIKNGPSHYQREREMTRIIGKPTKRQSIHRRHSDLLKHLRGAPHLSTSSLRFTQEEETHRTPGEDRVIIA